MLITFVPSILIVMLSWISFWLDVELAAPRVALGQTSLLTLAAQLNNAQRDLPSASNVKALDIWMFVCILLAFASLVEFAVACNFNKIRNNVPQGVQISTLVRSNKVEPKKQKETKAEIESEVKRTKPFSSKSFYLDLTSFVEIKTLSEDILLLGGSLELFFSKRDVTCCKKEAELKSQRVKVLRKPYIKFEEENRQTRPAYMEFSSWPVTIFTSDKYLSLNSARSRRKSTEVTTAIATAKSKSRFCEICSTCFHGLKTVPNETTETTLISQDGLEMYLPAFIRHKSRMEFQRLQRSFLRKRHHHLLFSAGPENNVVGYVFSVRNSIFKMQSNPLFLAVKLFSLTNGIGMEWTEENWKG
uniref:Neurotransmitter-gated ion-channel transmembrane domain-containing protein n=1 Tax=Strigamia maritima TaxID=126957 RepID=T1JD81_STRMM